ncbi:MAG: outer membrane lipoprotein-sorting protein [Candidatus Cloacimonadales bacterium]
MKKICFILCLLLGSLLLQAEQISAAEILDKMDENLLAESQSAKMKMIVHGRRNSRTLSLQTYSRGQEDSFTEYLQPARERGTKMLKLGENLWIYSPGSDRIIKISGHMLRQSVMGSDLSYEDLMSDTELQENYSATILNEEKYDGRACWKLELLAQSDDLAYAKRLLWVDKERFVALKEELYGLSGTLLKESIIHEVFQVEERWVPRHFSFRDVLKNGKGTEIIFEEIKFNPQIAPNIFSKAALRK